jgi:type II secretory ATPase GspE/PulE/Tfp pilus assembly ATPase PilB-like protein
VQVHARIGLTFAAAMRAFLRADPDVIMVGEMRDHETASTAVEASLTGHFVLSTLHTNNAPETVTRLLDMGLDPFSFADSLEAVLAQRLARRLCANCREKSPASADERAELERLYGKDALRSWMGATADMPWLLGRAKGCDKCAGTGYKGRVALHELLVTNDAIKAAIQRKLPVDELRSLAVHAGMATLIQDGIEKVLAGDLDLAQVLAVCSR